MAPAAVGAVFGERGLRSLVWQKLKLSVFDDCRKEEEWKIIILDDFTTKLLSSCGKMTDLLAEGITVCPDILFNKMKSSCSWAIRRCKEINVSFLPYESQVFTLDVPDAFFCCYCPTVEKAKGKDAIMEAMAEQIVTLCATLDENPGVRYKSKPLDNASKLAELVEKKLENYYKIDERSQIKGKTHSQLLIIDRGFDPVSTVLHELTFQAMAYDLLPIENDTYKQLSLSNLAQLMKKMPHFRKQITKQVVHLNIAEDCMSKFKSNIEKLCKTEQALSGSGGKRSNVALAAAFRFSLPGHSGPAGPPKVPTHSSCLPGPGGLLYRVVCEPMLYRVALYPGRGVFISESEGDYGTTQENLDKLIQNVQIESDSDMIKNWEYLGVPVVVSDAIENKLDSKEWPYFSQCPAAWNGSGAVSARQKSRTSYLDDRKNGSKLIVFVIGGITYSEMRSAYEVSQAYKSCEVVIGSTHILTPRRLLDDVKTLNKPKDTFCIKDEEKH
ncbi:Syntaxin-binding protein 3 [Chelonia mydas]|uniref:Syntaxin-binding protein 3 n=1 Tax=Chelonia mydas TaxID=8469 RepID=M7C6F2_CHEMY|nr:Syntaxin-binding protein 3 [Chelonia mydas]